MSKRPSSDSPKERGGGVSSSREHPAMAVVEATGGFTYRENRDEKWSEYVRMGTATRIFVHREATEGSEEGKVVVGSGEPFYGRSVRDIVGSA